MLKHKSFGYGYCGPEFPLPVRGRELWNIVDQFLFCYPIYDSFIQISKGEPLRFEAMWDKANDLMLLR